MKAFWIFLVVLVLWSCQDEPNPANGVHNVSGKVENIIVTDAQVSLDLSNADASYTSKANANGDYEFTNVVAGTYKLKVFQTNALGTVERTVDVDLSETDQTLDILLPEPVELFSLDQSTKTITLNWTLFSDSAFREYKIYKGTDAGLDETTGTLIYVSTESADTTFVDPGAPMAPILPNSDYYYRIFVMDARGKLAGSNVLHVVTNPEPEFYSLTLENNFGSNGDLGLIRGLAFDGTNLWVAHHLEVGGYFDNDKVTLAKYDIDDFSLITSFTYNDRYEPLGGLTFDGQNLWLQYTASGTGSNLIYKINPSTGERISNYATDYGVVGLSYSNDELYVQYYYETVQKWNPVTAGIISNHSTSDFLGGSGNNNSGIAVRPGEIWISARTNSSKVLGIGVFNSDFSLKGLVKSPFEYIQLCFVNDKLLVATPSRFYFYSITQN